MNAIDGASLGKIFKPAHWEKVCRVETHVLQHLVELPMPVIGGAR